MGRKCEKVFQFKWWCKNTPFWVVEESEAMQKSAYFFFGAAFFALGEAAGFLALGAAAFFGATFFGEAAGFFAGAAFLAAGLAPVFYSIGDSK